MTLASAAAWLENLAVPTAIREAGLWFPGIETVHVLALSLVVGSIATVDLRLLGLARREEPVWQVASKALPWTWTAFVIAAITGGLLFSSAAVKYTANPIFLSKMALLVAAGLNMAMFHAFTGKTITAWKESHTPLAAKIAGGLSIAIWIGVVACGRWVGFSHVDIPS